MKITLTAVVLLVGLAAPGFGQLLITLDNPTLSGAPGDTLTFSGSLSNTGGQTDFINGADINATDPGLSGDASPLLLFGPTSLNPGQTTISIPLFTITIADPFASAAGPFSGLFDVLGGTADTDLNLLGTADFNVVVTPEPSSFAMTLSGLMLLFAALRWPRRPVPAAV